MRLKRWRWTLITEKASFIFQVGRHNIYVSTWRISDARSGAKAFGYIEKVKRCLSICLKAPLQLTNELILLVEMFKTHSSFMHVCYERMHANHKIQCAVNCSCPPRNFANIYAKSHLLYTFSIVIIVESRKSENRTTEIRRWVEDIFRNSKYNISSISYAQAHLSVFT